MEFEVDGTKFKWWNEASRRARKKRTKNLKVDYFKIEKKNYCVVQTLL
jgi:hypothetical protein